MEILKKQFNLLLVIFSLLGSQASADPARDILAELSPLVKKIHIDMNADQQLRSARNLIEALERDSNPIQAERLLREIEGKEVFLKAFYRQLQIELENRPEVLERIRSSLANVRSKLRAERVVFPSFSRSWAALGILLATNDYLFSNFANLNAVAPVDIGQYTFFSKVMYSIAMVNLGIAALADALVLKRSANQLISEFREQRKAKKMTRKLIKMVDARKRGDRYLQDIVGSERGYKDGIENISQHIIELLEIKDASSREKIKNSQVIRRVSRYFQQRRMDRVLHKVGQELTPIELRKINSTLAAAEKGLRFDIDSKVLNAQTALIADFKAWEAAHSSNSIRDLVAESQEAEKALRTSKILKLKPHWIASLNYFVIGFSLTIASDVATVGIDSLPFDNAASHFLRVNRNTLTYYSALTGVIATAIHFLTYPRIRKIEKKTMDTSLQHLKHMDGSAWRFFRRTALLAQMDLEIESKGTDAKEWAKENAWSFLRTILKKHNLVPKLESREIQSCPNLTPF